MKKITIIGNSVGLRSRPSSTVLNYGCILDELGFSVNNLSIGRCTSHEAVVMKDLFIRTFPAYFVINLGAVDAPSREIPLWISDVIYGRRKIVFARLIMLFYRILVLKNRRIFTLLRGKRSWISKASFISNIELIISEIRKDTCASVIVVGINKGNCRIDRILPGTVAKYVAYNLALQEMCKRLEVSFIDVSDLDSSDYFPDGVHYNCRGHEELARRINASIIVDCESKVGSLR